MSELANGWVVRYQNDRDTALLELIQFFFNSSGCKGIVTPDLYRGIGGGFHEVLKKMTDDFQEDGSEYPLTINGQNFRQFKQRLGDFLHQFVSQSAEAELLYDEFMMDYVLQLLIEMSASPVRAFRHTGTESQVQPKTFSGCSENHLVLMAKFSGVFLSYSASERHEIIAGLLIH